MNTTELNSSNFDAALATESTPVLVDFWAPWCGPCKQLGPLIDEIATEQDGRAVVAKVNIDDAADLATRYGINSIPTLIVFKDGAPAKRIVGAKGKAALLQDLEEFLV